MKMFKPLLIFLFFVFNITIIHSQGGFGASQFCHNNVNCDSDWCDQARSVGLVYLKLDGINYERRATGFLINNERRDGTPYFMTAAHVIDRDKNGELNEMELGLIDSILIVFDYQSLLCLPKTPNIEPDTNQFVIGAELVSFVDDPLGSGQPDWVLLKLKKRIPINYQVYFSGFTASEEKPNELTIIHHPANDIKKISHKDSEPDFEGNFIWEIDDFTYGTIEGGSSGGPYFNQNKRVIGLQSQGNPFNPCNNDNLNSRLTMFHKIWDRNPDPNFNVKSWLNPIGEINLIGMNGNDFCVESYFFENANDLHTSENVSYASGLLPGSRSYDGKYFASGLIEAGQNVFIKDETNVEFYGNKIMLKPGFKSEAGSHFKAKPEPCERACNFKNNNSEDEYVYEYEEEKISQEKTPDSFKRIEGMEMSQIKVYPNPNNGSFTIHVNEQYINGTATLFDAFGKEVYTSVINEMKQEMNVEFLSTGLYHIVVLKQGLVYREKIMIE